MSIVQNQIDSPFVIISMSPIKDPYNIEDLDNIVLKTSDGTLLSFREAYANGTGGKGTGVTIELFDPENLFLLQFIDNNYVKGFKSFAKTEKGLDALSEAYDELDKIVNLQGKADRRHDYIHKLNSKTYEGQYKEEARYSKLIDDKRTDYLMVEIGEINKKKEKLKKQQDTIKNSNSNTFYITYGFGKNKNDHAPSRAFTFTKLEFIGDSAKQGSIRLGFSHNDSNTQGEKFDREKNRLKNPVEGREKAVVVGPVINIIKFSDNEPGKIELDEIRDISNLMEVTLQKFIRELSPSQSIPLVFLSPEVTGKIRSEVDNYKDENPIKGLILTRVGDSKAIYSRLLRVKGLHTLLDSLGFRVLTKYEDSEQQRIATPGRKTSRVDSGSYSKAYYTLAIQIDKGRPPIDTVIEIINNIYSKLGIAKGSDIGNITITESEHVNILTNAFVDPVPISGDGFIDFLHGRNTRRGTLKTQGGREWINVQEKGINTTSIHCMGDGLFIGGILKPLPYDEHESIFKEFEKFGNSYPRSNIRRFIDWGEDRGGRTWSNQELVSSWPEYLKIIRRIYVDPVRKSGRFDLPDEYAAKLPPSVSNNIMRKVPTFLANMQHSNVISFVATHSGAEQAQLLTNLPNLFNHTPFKTLKDGDTYIALKGKKKLTEEQIDGLLFDMLNYEYENSTSMGSLLSNIKKGWNSKDSDTAKAYKKVLTAFLVDIENSPLAEDHNISAHAVRSSMLYMQRLSLGISRVQVKTIPMFSIISEFWLTKPCLFLNKKLHSPNSTYLMNKESTFSGLYSIFGLEHVITPSECFSSFQIHRNAIASGEIEKSSPEN